MKKSIFILILFCNQSWSETTTWVNQSVSTNIIPNGGDSNIKISRNGRYIVFLSTSANLVENDSNVNFDLFVKDTLTGVTELISRTQNGTQFQEAVFYSSRPTSDGKYILFKSRESNLPFANGSLILYLKNLETGEISAQMFNNEQEPITSSSGNIFLSDDARYIYFSSLDAIEAIDTNNRIDLYRKDRLTNTFTLISLSTVNGQVTTDNATKSILDVSENGKFVTFQSNSTEIHPDASPASTSDYVGYIRDLEFSTTNIYTKNQLSETVYNDSNGNTSIVSNAGFVYFCSDGVFTTEDTNNQADNHIYSSNTGTVSRIPLAGIDTNTYTSCSESNNSMAIDNDENLLFLHNSKLLHPDATNSGRKLFQLDLSTMQVSLILKENIYSVSADSTLTNAAVGISSPNENIDPTGTTYSQAFKLDLGTLAVDHVSKPVKMSLFQNRSPYESTMSDDQKHFIYASSANNIVPEDSLNSNMDLYYFNKNTNMTDKIAVESGFYGFDISPNGKYVVFSSRIFHPITTIELNDVYVFLLDLENLQYSQIAIGETPSVNNQGDIVFSSRDSTLVANDNNNANDVFYFNNSSQSIQRISLDSNGIEGDGGSYDPKIAGEGISTWVVFSSYATNLVANDNNNKRDIFMINLPLGNIFRVNEVAGIGTSDNVLEALISTDTTKVVFSSSSTNIVGASTNYDQVIMFNRLTSTHSLISKDENGSPSNSGIFSYAISNTGKYISFATSASLLPSDTDTFSDIYLYNTSANEMRIVPKHNNSGYPDIIKISVDNNFTTPKTGILYQDSNESIYNLYGYNNIPNHDSLFLYQEGGDGELLTVSLTGNGFVVAPLGLSCPGTCTNNYPLGYEMNLTASPQTNNIFAGWQGECLFQSDPLDLTCTIRMDASKTVSALFLDENDRIFFNNFE